MCAHSLPNLGVYRSDSIGQLFTTQPIGESAHISLAPVRRLWLSSCHYRRWHGQRSVELTRRNLCVVVSVDGPTSLYIFSFWSQKFRRCTRRTFLCLRLDRRRSWQPSFYLEAPTFWAAVDLSYFCFGCDACSNRQEPRRSAKDATMTSGKPLLAPSVHQQHQQQQQVLTKLHQIL